MNAAACHIAEKPVNISVYATFSANGCDTSLYLGMTQLMSGGGIIIVAQTVIPQLSTLFS